MSQFLLLGHHTTIARRYSRGEEDAALPTLFPAPADTTISAVRLEPEPVSATTRIHSVSVLARLFASLGRLAATLRGGLHARETRRMDSSVPDRRHAVPGDAGR